MDERTMRIGEVAAQAGVRVSLLRYYEEVGLLRPPNASTGSAATTRRRCAGWR